MIVLDTFEQYSDEWWKNRLSVPTASQYGRVVTTTGKPSDSRVDYMYRLAVERVTGEYAGSEYMSFAMKEGHKKEPEARALFQMITGMKVSEAGMIFRDEQRKYGASPDGLMDGAGLEIFCPESPNFVKCKFSPGSAVKYAGKYQQIQGSLLVSGFERWHFIVYYPGLKPVIQCIERDEPFLELLEKELDTFCLDLALTAKKLRELEMAA